MRRAGRADEVRTEADGRVRKKDWEEGGYNSLDGVVAQLVGQHGVEEAREVAVQSLVTGNELIGLSQPKHQSSLL